MKKPVKIFVALMLFALLALSAVACGPDDKADPVITQGTKYGVPYGGAVCVVTVKLSDGDVTMVSFDELQTPATWARITNITTTIEEGDQIELNATTNYAAKIKIGDVVFEARTVGETNPTIDFFNEDKNDETAFETWLATEANAKWYYEQLTQGNYDVLKEDGTAYDVVFKTVDSGTLSKGDRWLKSKNGYWPADDTKKGWAANMKAMEDYLVANGFADYEAARETLEVSGEVVINGVSTGATISNFKGYMDLALAAKNIAA